MVSEFSSKSHDGIEYRGEAFVDDLREVEVDAECIEYRVKPVAGGVLNAFLVVHHLASSRIGKGPPRLPQVPLRFNCLV